MKKKTLALLLAIGCTLSIAACGTTSGDATSASEETLISRVDEAREELQKEFDEKEPETKEPGAEEPEEQSASAEKPTVLSDNLYDFQISIDGTIYQFPMQYSEFEALGWQYIGEPTNTLDPNHHALTEMWLKDGGRALTKFMNLSTDTVPYSESTVIGITLDQLDVRDCDWEIIMPNGIQWGVSDADDIILAYGEPTEDDDNEYYRKMKYEYENYRAVLLYVYKDDNTLKKIEIINVVK